MLKFLRLYKGWLLAVFGSLLLVVFLVPQAISGISQSAAVRGGTWARVGESGEKVNFAQLDGLQREMRILQAVGNPMLNLLGADRRPEHWYLLRREAEQAGLHGGPGDGQRMLASMTASINAQRAASDPNSPPLREEEVLGILCQNSGSSPLEALETLARLAGVTRLTSLFAGLDRYSDRRLEMEAATMLLGVSADLVVIDPLKMPGADSIELTAERLSEHLAAFAADRPGEGRHGFGYRTPDRFRLEWLVIPASLVREAVSRGEGLDGLTLRRRFTADPAAFGASPSAETRPRFEDFADQVRAVVIEETVRERLDDLAKMLGDRFMAAQRAVPRGSGGRYLVDEAWLSQMPSFESVGRELAEEFRLASPTIGSSGERWFTLDDLVAIPEIAGASTTRFGTTPLRVADLVQAAEAFGGSGAASLQVGIASPVLTVPSGDLVRGGDLVVVRLLAAEPSAPAVGIEERREQLEKDLARLLAFERLRGEVPQIEALAIAEGMRAVARRYDSTVDFVPAIREADPQFLQSGFKIASNLPGIGRDPEMIRRIVERALGLPIDRLASEAPVADRTFVLLDEERLLAAVVRIEDLLPLARETFEPLSTVPQFRQALVRSEFAEDLVEMFSYDAMAARNQFRRIRAGTEDETLVDGDEEFE